MARVAGFFLILLLSLAGAANGVVLDWSTISNWNNGDLGHTYDIDPSNPGPDITVQISGSTNAFNLTYPKIQTGGVVGGETGGGPAAGGSTAALQYNANFTSNNPSVTTTITFNYTGGVYASFGIYNVEASLVTGSAYASQIIAYGIAADGVTHVPLIASVQDPSNVALTNTGTTNLTATGLQSVPHDTNGANLYLSSGSTKVTQIVFTFTDAETLGGVTQAIALGDITFSPTPEFHPSLIAFFFCAGVVGLFWYERHKGKPIG
jgi:hypothetical protein